MPPPKTRLTDTSLWLHNKLGTSNDMWSGSSICSQLNQEVLKNIKDCFPDLQSQVKLKLLLSFLHIPRRNVTEWRAELDDILETAQEDTDPWVSTVAELLKTYPADFQINLEIQHNSVVFTDLITELKKLVKKHADKSILPLECLYLNKNALTSQVGAIPAPAKHFTLKRKSKSAALRAELLAKSSEAAASLKKTPITPVTVRARGLSDGPIRGIPRVDLGNGSFKTPGRTPLRTPVNRKDGGIKLLDITEQPVGRDAKRKKKNPDEKEKEEKTPDTEAAPTPDYAAGLTSAIPPSPAPAYSAAADPSPVKSKPPLQTPVSTSRVDSLMSQQPPRQPVSSAVPSNPTPENPPVVIQMQQQQPAHIIMNPMHISLDKKLSLSKEQMAEAQEMFRNSNKVSRPEKALILGFMAGSRDNPCPNLGNVVTIKLNESEETVTQADGTPIRCMVETHYQMNYNTGEGKRIKKYVKIDTSSGLHPAPHNLQQQSQQPV